MGFVTTGCNGHAQQTIVYFTPKTPSALARAGHSELEQFDQWYRLYLWDRARLKRSDGYLAT